MSAKKRKNVPVATENTPIEQVSAKLAENQTAPMEKEDQQAAQTSIPEPKPLTEQERLARLESAMTEVATYLQGINSQIQTLSQAPKSSGGIEGIAAAIGEALKSAPSSNPITDALTQRILDAGLAQMTMGTELLGTVQKKILLDLGAKIATETVTPH